MFNNIGKKIKIVTVISFITLCVCSIIAGIVSMVVYDDWKLYLVLILCVPFLLWISSFYAYGFGELIENTTKIKNTLQKDGSDKQTEAENDIEEDVDIEENIYKEVPAILRYDKEINPVGITKKLFKKFSLLNLLKKVSAKKAKKKYESMAIEEDNKAKAGTLAVSIADTLVSDIPASEAK